MRWTRTGAALVIATGLAACGSGAGTAAGGGGPASPTTLTVFAAASLTGAFEQLGAEFEAAHDGVEVRLSFAGSADLAAQIQQGAPADVFASADEATMAALTAEDLVGSPHTVASNTLQIAVPPGNPAGVQSLADLTQPDLNLVLCAPSVPCGAASGRVAAIAAVELEPVSEEQSVADVLSKVRSGEADAGLVYVTDVQAAAGAVEGIGFPEAADVVNLYPVATVTGTDDAELAADFVDFVVAEDGQSVLAEHGFGRP